MCRQIVQATAPAVYTQHARNPDHNVQIGGDATVFAPNYGSPFVHDLDNGRRYATIADFQNFVKLAYMSPYLHHSGGTVCEPVDVPVSKRHLDMVYAHIRYSDKPFMGSVTAGERRGRLRRAGAHRVRRRPRRPHGDDEPDQRLVAAGVGRHDAGRGRGLRRSTTRRRSSRRSSSPGRWRRPRRPASPPRRWPRRWPAWRSRSSCRPGAPVIFGSFASSMSMQTGAPTFGTPEPALVLYTVAALARRLGVPFRSGGSLMRLEAARRAGRLRVGGDAAADDARRRQLRAARRRLARGRAGDRLREVRARLRPARDDGDVRQGPRPVRERPGARRHPREPARPALPRHGPHARQLRVRVLPLGHRRQLAASSSGSRTAGSTPPSAPTRLWKEQLAAYEPPPHRRRDRRRTASSSSTAAKPSCPTRSPETG